MTDQLAAWLRIPRERTDLAQPNGRALFAYRMTAEDFRSLELVLRERLSLFATLDAFTSISPSFPGIFVLYSAEWWRRRYDGSGWTWQTILADLGADRKPWSPLRRGECVERGLRHWRLPSTSAGGLRYLRAIALQGGLPLNLLACARGSLARVLRRVLTLARIGAPSPVLIRGWVESLQHELPQSYRHEAIYDLLTEVIGTVLDVVQKAQITRGADAIQRLDASCPDWRERFPLPIDDTQARGLIEQLVQEAASGPPPARVELRAERWLEPLDGRDWTLCATLAAPDQLTTEVIQSKFAIPPSDPLPRAAEIRLEADNQGLGWTARRLAGRRTYRLEPHPQAIKGIAASSELRLRLIAPDARAWPGEPQRGEALDSDLPWLFEADAAGTPRWVRQGGGGSPGATALVAIPADWSLRRDDGCAVAASGRILAPQRVLYPIQGKTTVTASCGRTWRIRTGEAQTTESDFHWVGDRLWDDFIEPSLAFRGLSRLYDGARAVPDSALTWRPNPQTVPYGPRAVAYLQHGEQVHGARLVLLPTGARIKLMPNDVKGGELRLEGWQAASANVATPGVEAICVVESDALALHLAWRPAEPDASAAPCLPPEWVEVTVTWPKNPGIARLRLPFPGRGVHAFDGSGQPLAANTWVPIHRLAGVRLVATGLGQKLGLLLQLRPTQGGALVQARLPLRAAPGQTRVEVRLQDFVAEIDRLLAANELLDAWVEASLCAGPDDLFKLRLSRYLCPLERQDPDVALTPKGLARIDPEALAGLSVLALRLEVPAEEAVLLTPRVSGGVATGAWTFVTPEREPGSWLIHSGSMASERVRPTLWTIPGENPAASPLTRALALEDRVARSAALDAVIAGLAEDFGEPCWLELERLAGHLGHLPLGSFDLWRRLVHSPAAMVALALRLHTDLSPAFVARIAQELPFTWELIPFPVWVAGAQRLRQQCIAWFGNIHWRRELRRRLEDVQRTSSTEHPALSKLLGVVQCLALVEESAELKAMRRHDIDDVFKEQLFGGRGSALNALLTGHADDEWPAAGKRLQWITHYRTIGGPGSALLCNDFHDYRDIVINLPILLAIQVATAQTDAWFAHPAHVYALRCVRAFDPDWFDTAFDLTIARCLSTGVLTLDF